jgi:cytochrome c oxidase cbb3-type subunit 3
MANRRIDQPTGIETVGHEWDGIEELNNPLPRWWVIILYITIAFSIGYMVVYPAIPLAGKGTEGLWGWTSRGELAAETAAAQQQRDAALAGLSAIPIEKLPDNPQLMAAAIAGGKAAFRVNCVQCHGSAGGGSLGYPNLNDDDWLWGGNLKEIEQTITHGVRQPGNDATRTSLMPSFGKDGILSPAQVNDVTNYVLTLSGKAQQSASSANGARLFADNCVTCHGNEGKGLRQFGAPNLADAIWLYGGKREQVAASIDRAHAGVMPAWQGKLDANTIKLLAAYVHSLGGGEDFAEAPAKSSADEGNAQPSQ